MLAGRSKKKSSQSQQAGIFCFPTHSSRRQKCILSSSSQQQQQATGKLLENHSLLPRAPRVWIFCCSTMINCIFPSGMAYYARVGTTGWLDVALEYKLNWKLPRVWVRHWGAQKKRSFFAHCFTYERGNLAECTLTSSSKKNGERKNTQSFRTSSFAWKMAPAKEIKGKYFSYVCEWPDRVPSGYCVFICLLFILFRRRTFFSRAFCFCIADCVSQWCNNSIGSVRWTTGSNRWTVWPKRRRKIVRILVPESKHEFRISFHGVCFFLDLALNPMDDLFICHFY